jgi:hypothetical protein
MAMTMRGTDPRSALTEQRTEDFFMTLSAFALNCSLDPPKEVSSIDKILDEVRAALGSTASRTRARCACRTETSAQA